MLEPQARPIRAVTLREQVAEALRQAILSGELKAGERLRELDLARRFGVSRNPIREAIGELEQQGLIVSVPNQGKRVVSPTDEELQGALQIRICLEQLALRLAWPHLTQERQDEWRTIVAEMRRVASDASLTRQQQHGRLNTLDAEFHSRLIEWSGNRALMRAWFAASPWGLAFIKDLERSKQMPESPALSRLADPHDVFLDAVESGNMNQAEELLASHVGRSRESMGAAGHAHDITRGILDRASEPHHQQGEAP